MMGKYVKVPVEFAGQLVKYLSTKPICEAKGFFDGFTSFPVCEDVEENKKESKKDKKK